MKSGEPTTVDVEPTVDGERATTSPTTTRFRPIDDEVAELERARMVAALAVCDGVRNKAAALIQMPLRTFVTKFKRFGITPTDWQASRPR